ncbi:MAG TPA: SIMPL domain-containing protein, partial [Candidatus Binatia bacterium]
MRYLLALVLPALLLGAARAQEPKPAVPSITVSAESVVTVEPDQAEIDIGVVSEGKTAAEAAQANAARLAAVIAGVKKLLKAGDQTKTVSYSVSPNYRYPKDGKPEIAGYTATNVVQVRLAAIQDAGKVIDAATGLGANRIQRLVFTLKDEEAPQREALRGATVKARAKAEEVARALGAKISRVVSVTENERSFRPVMQALAMEGGIARQVAP